MLKNVSTNWTSKRVFYWEDIMMDREEELLTSREAARILDLSPDTVNEFARKNILPAFKKGKQWRFRKRDIFSFNKKQVRGIQAA